MASILQAVIESILPSKPQPVVPNRGLIKAMDLSFLGLLSTLFGLLFITDRHSNLHILALMLVAICLWVTIRWFINELGRMNDLNKPIQLPSDPDLLTIPKEDSPTHEPTTSTSSKLKAS